MVGVQRLPLIEQSALDEWGTASSPVGRHCRWTTKKKQDDNSPITSFDRLPLIEHKTFDEWGTVSYHRRLKTPGGPRLLSGGWMEPPAVAGTAFQADLGGRAARRLQAGPEWRRAEPALCLEGRDW
jgi:hypothetical protein